MRILCKGFATDHTAVLDDGREGSPMGEGKDPPSCHQNNQPLVPRGSRSVLLPERPPGSRPGHPSILGGEEQGMKSQSQDWGRPRRGGTSSRADIAGQCRNNIERRPPAGVSPPSGPPRRCLPLATALRRYLRSTSDRLPAPTRTRTLQSATLPGDCAPALLVSQSPRRRNREFPFGGNVSSVDI